MKILTFSILIILSSCASYTSQQCSKVHELAEGWYDVQMNAAGIFPLCKSEQQGVEKYRFTWLRTFHNPIFITLHKQQNNIELSAIRLDGAGGYDPGSVIEQKNTHLSKIEFDEFKELLSKLDFWNLLSEDELREKVSRDSGMLIISADGAQWVLEGSNNKRVHVVDRNSYLNDTYKNVALYLLNKSQINTNGEVY